MRQQFEAELDRDPANWGLRLIFADWLDEQGDHIAARCQRWMGENEKRPDFDIATESWDWWVVNNQHVYLVQWHPRLNSATIPLHVFQKITNNLMYGLQFKEYPTRIAAESALADALEAVRVEEACPT